MKTLCIPELGTKLILDEDWAFNLYNEDRNESLVKAAGFPAGCDSSPYYAYALNTAMAAFNAGWGVTLEHNQYQRLFYKLVTLPTGSILTVDRIYIRKGASGYSSVSFYLDRKSVDENYSIFTNNISKSSGKCRFWAKLNDVNNIIFK